MAYVLNTTLSDQFANSYADVPFADDYFDNHYLSTRTSVWTGLTDDQKISVLIAACRTLETVRFTDPSPQIADYTERYDKRTHTVRYFGLNRNPSKYFFYQSLQFPRQNDIDINTGTTFMPEAIKMAQCEQAVYILTFDETAISNKLQGIGRDSTTLGTLKISQSYNQLGTRVAPAALEFIRPYIIKLSTSVRRG